MGPLQQPPPARGPGWVPPIFPYTQWLYHTEKNFFLAREKVFVCLTVANPELIIKLYFMKTNALPTHTSLVNIHESKSHDFLYVIKKANTDTWLPRISKAIVKDIIKSPGLYNIIYRLYTNEKGYESIFISKAQRVMTE
jgi:hypothetical protein